MKHIKKYITSLLVSYLFPAIVTFSVDMQEQYVSQNGIYLAGADTLTVSSFGMTLDSLDINPWSPEEIIMDDDDFDGIFSASINLENNTVYKYKFLNGFEYELSNQEDRILEVGTEDMILDLKCYDKIDDSCEIIDNSLVEVIFTVDTNEIQVSENGIFLLGANDSFTNFGYNLESLEPIEPYDPSVLNLEEQGDGIYSISIYLVPGVTYQYKFVNGNGWSGVEQVDRSIIVSEVSGVILNEVCFNSIEDCPEFTTLVEQLTFRTDVSNAISNNGFELGDMLIVKWGYGETQITERIDTLSLQPFSYTYKIDIDSVMVSEEAGLYYQYYKVLDDDSQSREIFFNFEYDNDDIYLAERRFFPLIEQDNFSEILILDNIDSNVDQRRMPVFLNTSTTTEEIEVTWTIDLRPAYYQVLLGDTLLDIQGVYSVVDADSVYEWGVWMNGPASMPANGETWTQWGVTLQGTTSKKMWDDGTHGDSIAGDHIYSLKLNYDIGTQVGQECKFGIKGGDNESSFGLNHYENINVDDPNIHIYWGSINPLFYSSWDYDLNIPIESEQCVAMDTNLDNQINVVDIVTLVNIIFNLIDATQEQLCAADTNSDGQINVVDVVTIVNFILNTD